MSVDFFKGDEFKKRSCLLDFIFKNYQNNKAISFDNSKYRGSSAIFLTCSESNCNFKIVCKKGKGVESIFKFIGEASELRHGIYDRFNGNKIGFCNADSRNVSSAS
jgi:hypothetical protein